MQGSNKKYPEPETGTDPVLTNMKFCKNNHKGLDCISGKDIYFFETNNTQ